MVKRSLSAPERLLNERDLDRWQPRPRSWQPSRQQRQQYQRRPYGVKEVLRKPGTQLSHVLRTEIKEGFVYLDFINSRRFQRLNEKLLLEIIERGNRDRPIGVGFFLFSGKTVILDCVVLDSYRGGAQMGDIMACGWLDVFNERVKRGAQQKFPDAFTLLAPFACEAQAQVKCQLLLDAIGGWRTGLNFHDVQCSFRDECAGLSWVCDELKWGERLWAVCGPCRKEWFRSMASRMYSMMRRPGELWQRAAAPPQQWQQGHVVWPDEGLLVDGKNEKARMEVRLAKDDLSAALNTFIVRLRVSLFLPGLLEHQAAWADVSFLQASCREQLVRSERPGCYDCVLQLDLRGHDLSALLLSNIAVNCRRLNVTDSAEAPGEALVSLTMHASQLLELVSRQCLT